MKEVLFRNIYNGEEVICNDTSKEEIIEGIKYLIVHRQGNDRSFLMRKDALKKINKNDRYTV